MAATAPSSAWAMENDSWYIGPYGGADVYKRPSRHAPKQGHLPHLAPVVVIGKRSQWKQIEYESEGTKEKGWIASGAIYRKVARTTPAKARHSFFSSFTSLFGDKSIATERTAVLGVRGLGAGPKADRKTVMERPDAERIIANIETMSIEPEKIDAFVKNGHLNP